MDIFETEDGIEVIILKFSSRNFRYYSIEYSSSTGEWSDMKTIVTAVDFLNLLELPLSTSHDDTPSIRWIPHWSGVYNDRSLISTWGYHLTNSTHDLYEIVTMYKTKDNLVNLLSMNGPYPGVYQVHFSDETLYFAMKDENHRSFMRQYNLTDGEWSEMSCLDCTFFNVFNDRKKINEPSKFIFERDGKLEVFDAEQNTTNIIRPNTNIEHYQVRSINNNLVDFLIVNSNKFIWETYDINQNVTIQNHTIIEDTSGLTLLNLRISTSAYTVFTWTDGYQIFGMDYVDGLFTDPQQITRAIDYTDDSFRYGEDIGSPFFDFIITSGIALFCIRRRRD